MPHPCVVCGRSRLNPNNREEEYTFFGFPVNDEERCKQWLEFCCREDLYKLTRKQLLQRMVCSKHFQTTDFTNEFVERLYATAVPSIYDPKQSLYNITCVICGRTRRDPADKDCEYVTFHHFPGEEFRCLKWLDFVGIDSYYRLTRKEIMFCYICSKHFDKSQFMPGYKNRLVTDAIPSIKHPNCLDVTQSLVPEVNSEPKLPAAPEKLKKLDPLPPEVLESQACAACGRLKSDPRNKIERYKFHPFPAYEIGRCLRWCQFLGREDVLKMSPNQIRKLVLCSKHFQIGESFHKIGPFDAVPTIKDVSEGSSVYSTELDDEETVDDPNCLNGRGAKKVFSRPLVSSKKPKVDNKPMPLGKKRGKSKRPTLINIPVPDPNNAENRGMLKKLPLPPNSNWNFQFADQFQPISLTNNVTSGIGNIANSIKKVILPFAGDISKLGAPIPVDSLSSIPPGLLIKINLPEQEQQKPVNSAKSKNKPRDSRTTVDRSDVQENRIWIQNNESSAVIPTIESSRDQKSLVQLLAISPESETRTLDSSQIDVQEEVILPPSLNVLNSERIDIKEERFYSDLEEEGTAPPVKKEKTRRKKMSKTARRTLFPIRCEIKQFLRKLKPFMHRLPRKTRAQIKLSIVNTVIDHL